MKKIIAVCFLLLFAAAGIAQVKSKRTLNELNQEELNVSLTKTLMKIKTVKISAGVGAGLGVLGGILLIDDMNKRKNSTDQSLFGNMPTDETGIGLLLAAGGIIIEGISIPLWIARSRHKRNIELELLKFNPSGSASINGIGLKIRF